MAIDPEFEVSAGGEAESLIQCHLGELLEARGMTLAKLSEMVDVSVVNLSILKNNRAKAIRYSTLAAICQALDCNVGDLLRLNHLPETETDRA